MEIKYTNAYKILCGGVGSILERSFDTAVVVEKVFRDFFPNSRKPKIQDSMTTNKASIADASCSARSDIWKYV